jgi:uncharacterized protein
MGSEEKNQMGYSSDKMQKVPPSRDLSHDRSSQLKERWLLVLWVTTDCNLRCRYCYVDVDNEPEYMNWHVAKRAIDFMLGRSCNFNIQFAGGEPLLNLPLIEKVVHYTQGLNIHYQLQTNATLIDAEIAGDLKRLGIDVVGVSLDGVPAVNDSLRPFTDGRGSTTATIAGLQCLRTAGIRVGLTCVLSADNVEGLPGLIDLASYLGIDGISLDLLRLVGRAKRGGIEQANPQLASQYLSSALKRADELAFMGGRRVRFREIEHMRRLLSHRVDRRYRCYFDAGHLLMVKPNGDAYPCPSLTGFPEFYLGNIMEEGSTGELVNNMKKTRRLISPPKRCLSCHEHWLCGGQCPAQTYFQQLMGEMKPTECHVKRVFIDYAAKKESYATANKISLSI